MLENRPTLTPGRGEAVLLIHGLGGGTYELQPIGAALHAALGVTVRAMQLPGHAPTSSGLMPASNHAQWVAQAQAELALLKGPVHVVGFSTGSTIALRLAELGLVSGRLVLLAPLIKVYQPLFLPVPTERVLMAFPWLGQVPRLRPPLRDRDVRRAVANCLPFRTMNLDAARSAAHLCQLVLADLPLVQVETLVLQGRRDTVVDPNGARTLVAGLRCPHHLIEFDDSNHLLALDREAARVRDEVVAFVGKKQPDFTQS